MKKEYKDNIEFLSDVRSLANELENVGNIEAANAIKEGIGLINGLTDGWALFLEALNKVSSDLSSSLSTEQKEKLSFYINRTHKVVHRE